MEAAQALEILDLLAAAGVRFWVDGGWGVDALVGEQTRSHQDLDLVVVMEAVPRLQAALGEAGFTVTEDELPTRFVMSDSGTRAIDFHPVTLDEAGGGLQVQPDGSKFRYPPEGFVEGKIGGRRVPCISAEVQLLCHTGYEPDETDRHDLALLCERFDLPLPPAYRS